MISAKYVKLFDVYRVVADEQQRLIVDINHVFSEHFPISHTACAGDLLADKFDVFLRDRHRHAILVGELCAAENVKMEMRNALAGVVTAVGITRIRRDTRRASRFSECFQKCKRRFRCSYGEISSTEAMWVFGITSTCTGACGLISRNARIFSSSYSLVDGISPAAILQKRQFSI